MVSHIFLYHLLISFYVVYILLLLFLLSCFDFDFLFYKSCTPQVLTSSLPHSHCNFSSSSPLFCPVSLVASSVLLLPRCLSCLCLSCCVGPSLLSSLCPSCSLMLSGLVVGHSLWHWLIGCGFCSCSCSRSRCSSSCVHYGCPRLFSLHSPDLIQSPSP